MTIEFLENALGHFWSACRCVRVRRQCLRVRVCKVNGRSSQTIKLRGEARKQKMKMLDLGFTSSVSNATNHQQEEDINDVGRTLR